MRPENRPFELIDTETIVILVRNNTRTLVHRSLRGKKWRKKICTLKTFAFVNLLLQEKKKNLHFSHLESIRLGTYR